MKLIEKSTILISESVTGNANTDLQKRQVDSMTIKDIAARVQVSVTTVSRVLNDKPDVHPQTRKKILEVIEESGYRPSGLARGLAMQKTNIIAFLVPDITNPNFPELARGVVDRAKEFGYSVMFFDTNHDVHMEKEAIHVLESKQVDGIILSFSGESMDELQKLKREHFPAVQIYRKSPNSVISTIAIDNVESAYKATKYLVDLGHRNIAHLARSLKTMSGQERVIGYKRALADLHIPLRAEWLLEGEYTRDSGYANMNRLLDMEIRPTAVFAANDVIAIGAYQAIYDRGLTIPDDISIVGHDDIEFAEILRPRLTTVTTFKYKLGQAAVDLVLEEISGSTERQKEIIFHTELVVRDSASELQH